MDLISYLFKVPFYVLWNIFMLFVWSILIILRNPRIFLSPKAWLTLFIFYVLGALFILLFLQIPLDIMLILLTGKPLAGWIPSSGSWLTDYALSSLLSTLLFILLFSALLRRLSRMLSKFGIVQEDVINTIEKFSSERLISKVKQTIFLLLIALLLVII